MDLAIRMDFTDNQRNRINAVREWYNVMYLSEITNENGRTIMDGVLFGSNPIQKYCRRSDGPKQKKPNTYSFKFWQKLFQPLLLNGCGNQLKQELGNWTKNHSKCGEWAAYQCENHVYEYREQNELKSWRLYSQQFGKQLIFEHEVPYDSYYPTKATPVAIQSFSNGNQFCDLTAVVETPISNPVAFGPQNN